MGKTRNDEDFEEQVRQGQRGGLLDDWIHGLTNTGTPSDKGYEYGAQHRYGPEGRYHTWDNRGSNDPKNESRSSVKTESRQSSRETSTQSVSSGGDSYGDCGDEYNDDNNGAGGDVASETIETHHESAIEKKAKETEDEIKKLAGSMGRFRAYHNTSPQTIRRALDSGLYSGVTFVPTNYLNRYRCTRCNHEWDEIRTEYNLHEIAECRMGCSNGHDRPSFFGLCKIIKALITCKEPFGYGRLIRSEKF